MGYGLWAVGHGLQTTRHTHDRRLAVDECANRSCYTYYETSTRTKIDGQQQCTRHNIAMKSMGHAMHQSWDSDCFEQTVEQTLCQTTPPCSSSPGGGIPFPAGVCISSKEGGVTPLGASCVMHMQRAYASCTCIMHMQHVSTSCICIMHIHANASCICTIPIHHAHA